MNKIKQALIVLLSVQFIGIGIMKTIMPLFGFDMFLKSMAILNYNQLGTFIIGSIDLLGGIGILLPRTRGYSIIGLILLMSGAISAHITAGDSLVTILGGSTMSMLFLAILFHIDKPFAIIDKRNEGMAFYK